MKDTKDLIEEGLRFHKEYNPQPKEKNDFQSYNKFYRSFLHKVNSLEQVRPGAECAMPWAKELHSWTPEQWAISKPRQHLDELCFKELSPHGCEAYKTTDPYKLLQYSLINCAIVKDQVQRNPYAIVNFLLHKEPLYEITAKYSICIHGLQLVIYESTNDNTRKLASERLEDLYRYEKYTGKRFTYSHPWLIEEPQWPINLCFNREEIMSRFWRV